MARFTKEKRQEIIEGYLTATGANLFDPADFVDWLAENKDHEAYPWFFGQGDEIAAREHRISMARNMANGLRIVTRYSEPPKDGSKVKVTVSEFPAFISPVKGRRSGGGYMPFDPKDEASRDELRRQAATALRSWLNRYSGIAREAGVSLDSIEKIAASLDDRVALSA